MHRFACPPNVVANDARAGDVLDHDERRRLVEIEAAVLLGDRDAEEAELTGAADQRPRELPVLRLEPLESGSTSLSTNSCVVCAISRCSSVSFSGVKTSDGDVVFEQPRAALAELCRCRHRLSDCLTSARRFPPRPCRRRRTSSPARSGRCGAASRRAASPSAWRRCSRADGRGRWRRR